MPELSHHLEISFSSLSSCNAHPTLFLFSAIDIWIYFIFVSAFYDLKTIIMPLLQYLAPEQAQMRL